jgi:hypothetical protein
VPSERSSARLSGDQVDKAYVSGAGHAFALGKIGSGGLQSIKGGASLIRNAFRAICFVNYKG